MYPAALGEATLTGGAWDGATWTPYNPTIDEMTNQSGPVVMTRDNTDWFVYRTDFPGAYPMLISLEFENTGLSVGDVIACETSSYPRIESTDLSFNLDSASLYTPPEPEIPSGENIETCTMSAMPMVGTIDYSTSPWTINSNNLSSSGGQDFTINLGTNEYGFFAYPAALGEAYFYDRDNMNIL
ncbi:hypothetical protein, partial [Oleiphilus sp. HI0061]|uniref:hypothetical protein n=1 Tax=Oleiphilus sp. HI0061 TaxID=1822239 RepID=UPI0012E715F3